MAALLAAQITGCKLVQIEQTLKQFPGLPHRLEWVRSLKGVSFYNDSKATNVSATLAALESLEPPIVLIAGGLGKGQDFTSLGPALQQRTKAVVLLGKDAPKIAAVSKQFVPTFIVPDLRAAVRKAWELARPKGQVLLSPACASFDMFKGYQERGEYFKEEVYAL
jgi:UDP-N-acetylmuramoylalanine--D-glutamate ligase